MAVILSNDRALGAELLRESVIHVDLHYAARDPLIASAGDEPARLPDFRPRYDTTSRKLWFDGVLLKRLKRGDNNQELILIAFDEEGWPEHIFDPLKPKTDVEPCKRLTDTIFAMNRSIEKQVGPSANYLVRFHVDDRGTVIRWESVDATSATPAQAAPRVWRPRGGSGRLDWRPRRCR